MFDAVSLLNHPEHLSGALHAYVGRELFVNKDLREGKEAAIEVLGKFTTLACLDGTSAADEAQFIALRTKACKLLRAMFMRVGWRFDTGTYNLTRA